MVDVPRLGALLQRIRDEVAALRHLARREGMRDDDVALPAAKYRLVVAIEAMIDVAEHVIASEGLRRRGVSRGGADGAGPLAPLGAVSNRPARGTGRGRERATRWRGGRGP